MNKRKNFIISSLATLLLLVSCSSNDIIFERYSYDVIDKDFRQTWTDGNVSQLGYYKSLRYVNGSEQTEYIESYDELYRSQNYLHKMNSTGNSKMLVIPVDFADYTCDRLAHGCPLSRTLIQNAFFGKESRTQYESVASYFDKSSYGKLKIDGKVTDWFRPSVTYADLQNPSTNKTIVVNIYKEALAWYQNKYGDLASYYVNGDPNQGLPIYFIYSAPADDSPNGPNTPLWAYTFNSEALVSWTSFSMLNLDTYNKVDSHTLIHETGHLLGLDDYYATNGNYSPTGHIDMMDYSIGDETAFSKMLLDWIRPIRVEKSITYSLTPFESTGNVLLLNKNWNESAMDEYILLEYYTPTGLNEKDSKSINVEAKLPTKPGLKVYHVDSRAGFFENKIKPVGYLKDGGKSKENYRVGIVHSNSVSPGNEYTKYPLYQLLEKDGGNSFMSGGIASNDSLWHEGDTFGETTFVDYKFHSGEDLGITFKVDKITSEFLTLTITYK